VPVTLPGGKKVLGWARVGLAQTVVESAVRRNLIAISAISLAIMVLGVGLTFVSLRVLVRPLSELSQASEAVGRGDLQLSVPVRSQDEIGRLASNFNAMIQGLKAAEAARMEQGRIEGELQLAHSIQKDLLPAHPPQVTGLDVAFTCLPAKELGGDFYDCIEINGGDQWGFLIADVSGKGVPAALHMANLRNLFRVLAPQSDSPLETVKKVNAMAHADMRGEAFVTLVYAVIDPRSLKGRLVVAGHDPVYCQRGPALEVFDRTAPPVGLVGAKDFDRKAGETAFSLAKGDMLFTYTDGVTEAMSSGGEQFSLARVQASLLTGGRAGAVVGRILEAVRAHAAGAEQSDDITMLAVKAG
jgi:sigma-B regulation protein RsbU (phosphoserine phosphatase)